MSKQLPSVLPRGRSPLARLSGNPSSESPFRSSIKHTSLRRLEGHEVDAFIQKLQENRQNLCTCFDIYQLLFQNAVPQRCVLHNNFVTLYCEDEQKLLCVNCIYSTVKHQSHRVMPIKNAFDNIQQDNRANEKRLKQVVETLDGIYQRAFNVVADCKQGLEITLRELNDEYENIQKVLVEKYESARESIIERYNELGSKYKVLEKQLSWLRDTYRKREASLPKSEEEGAELYEHILLNTLLDPDKIQIRAIDPLNNQELKNQLLSEMLKIRNFVEGRRGDKKRIF